MTIEEFKQAGYTVQMQYTMTDFRQAELSDLAELATSEDSSDLETDTSTEESVDSYFDNGSESFNIFNKDGKTIAYDLSFVDLKEKIKEL